MKKLTINRIAVYLTLACNLRCKLCSVFSPYYKKPYHPLIEDLYRYIDRCFVILDDVNEFFVSGGEPLLRNDFHLFMNHLYNYYERISVVHLYTNGTIIPDTAAFESLEKWGEKLYVTINDYGPELSTNALAVCQKLSNIQNARIELRDYSTDDVYFGGWVDFGVSPLSEKHRKSDEYAKSVFQRCAIPQKLNFNFSIANGVLYPCTRMRALVEQDIIKPSECEAIDLFDKTLSDVDIRAKITSLFSIEYMASCVYCNGLCEDNERYTPAQQFTDEEMKQIKRI